MNRKKLLKILIPICCVVVAAAIICGVVFNPAPNEMKINNISLVKEKQTAIPYSDAFEKLLVAGNAFLSVNKESSAIAMGIRENVFNAFSQASASAKLSSVFSVSLRDEEGNRYFMNSTDNSVDFGSFEVSVSDGRLHFDFALYVNKKDFEKGEKAAVWVKIPVELSVKNGGFVVEADMGSSACADGLVIESISLLPGLFCVDIPSENMQYYLPEGCGAALSLDVVSEKDFSETLSVYGTDIAFEKYSPDAVLPCFAFSDGRLMASVIIDEGDALSEINVSRDKLGKSTLYNSFRVTPFSVSDGKLLKGESYDGKLSQIYYLTDKKGADYNELAHLTRDFLISKGYIPSVMSNKFTDLPFFVTAIGSSNGKKNNVYTDFENASEIIALLKSRGVRSVALRFAGGSEKGLASGLNSSGTVSDTLGGKKELKELCQVADANNSSVWYDFNLALGANTTGSGNALINEKLNAYLSAESVSAEASRYPLVEASISSAYKLLADYESMNTSINDLSYLLYSDLKEGIDRQSALGLIKEKTEALSLGGMMLEAPAVYLMKNADAVFSMPEKTNLEGVEGATSVPVLQMVLHGSLAYGTEPVNLSSNSKSALLKAVEFGASPSFVFTYDNCKALDYGLYAAQTAKLYSEIKQIMPLMDMEITGHEKVVSGVYKITYDYSKIVYVNYNPSVVEVNGIMISAEDFVII